MKPSRRCPYEVFLVGTDVCNRSIKWLTFSRRGEYGPIRSTHAEFLTMYSIFSSAVASLGIFYQLNT